MFVGQVAAAVVAGLIVIALAALARRAYLRRAERLAAQERANRAMGAALEAIQESLRRIEADQGFPSIGLGLDELDKALSQIGPPVSDDVVNALGTAVTELRRSNGYRVITAATVKHLRECEHLLIANLDPGGAGS